MLDPKLIRADPDAVAAGLRRRGFDFDPGPLPGPRGTAQRAAGAGRGSCAASATRNPRRSGRPRLPGEDAAPLMNEVQTLGDALDAGEAELEDSAGRAVAIAARIAESAA